MDYELVFTSKTHENTQPYITGQKYLGDKIQLYLLKNSLKLHVFSCFLMDVTNYYISSGIDSSDDDSSSEGDEMPWQQIWLSSDSDLDYNALRRENNWSVC